ncbi:MAG TPA: hypothetical protein VFL42_14360 [Terriglobales bacterium]|nr:hypothetical protein [Terriglobales bacterium]
MLIRLSQTDDLPAQVTPLPLDDDAGEGWLAGAHQSFATMALAGVLAASAFTAKLAAAVHNVDPVEIAPGAVSTAFEDDAPQLAPRQASPQPRATALQCVEDDAPQFTAPAFTPDEDSFTSRQINYPQPRVAALQFADDDAPQFTVPAFTADEDGLTPLRPIAVYPQPRAAELQYVNDEGSIALAPPAVVDEDFWLSAVRCTIPSFIFLPQNDAGSIAFAPPSVVDEDFWLSAAKCAAQTFIAAPQADDASLPLLTVVDEEAIFILRRPWMMLAQPAIPASQTYSAAGEFLPLRAAPILARGAVSAAPAHGLVTSAKLAHASPESAAVAHSCAVQSVATHSLTAVAAPAHTFVVEVVI